jgi:hypothetical protein
LLRGQRYTSAKISAAEFSPAGPPFSAVEDFRAATRFPAAEDFWFPAQHFLFPTQSLSATGDGAERVHRLLLLVFSFFVLFGFLFSLDRFVLGASCCCRCY